MVQPECVKSATYLLVWQILNCNIMNNKRVHHLPLGSCVVVNFPCVDDAFFRDCKKISLVDQRKLFLMDCGGLSSTNWSTVDNQSIS